MSTPESTTTLGMAPLPSGSRTPGSCSLSITRQKRLRIFKSGNTTRSRPTFDRTIEDAFVTFALNPVGRVDHFTMIAVSPLADFSFDFQDLYFTPVKAAEKK